jgi:hypothetical protein
LKKLNTITVVTYKKGIMENNIQDSVAMAKTVRLINSLPDDVMRHIYEEYFVGIEACNKFLELLKSENSHSLEYKPLIDLARRLLQYPCAVEYLCGKHTVFKKMYIEHYIKNNKSFLLMDMLESFVLSILMHLYH